MKRKSSVVFATPSSKRSKKYIVASKKQRHTYGINYPASIENKFHDVFAGSGGIADTGTIYNLTSTIAQGTTSKTRIGKEISLNSLLIRMTAKCIDTTNNIRVIIFIWKRPGSPVVADVLQDVVTLPSLSPINRDNVDYITVLRDKFFDLSLATNEYAYSKEYIKFNNDKAQWNEGGTADYGQVFMLAISDSAVATHPDFAFASRVRFSG